MSNRLHWIQEQVDYLEQAGLRRYRTTRESPAVSGLVQIDGDQFINFGSNDYLALAARPELVHAVELAIGQLGYGATSSPAVCGRATMHRRLESELAEFEDCEAALLFPSGYAANVGAICALVGPGDVIFSDALNHASIIDGCRLSGAKIVVYPHADCDALKNRLQMEDGMGRRLLVTDGLFSMDGDLAPLPQLASLADEFRAMLMVDEAHATGVFGRFGRGASEFLGVENQIDIRVGTLSKALGGAGGFVVGSQLLIDWLANVARTYVYSTAQPEINSAVALAALKHVQENPDRRTDLLAQAAELRTKMVGMGWDVGIGASQIIPLIVGSEERALQISAGLREDGIYVPAIRPPSVPPGQSRLRISLNADHSTVHFCQLMDSLQRQIGRNSTS